MAMVSATGMCNQRSTAVAAVDKDARSTTNKAPATFLAIAPTVIRPVRTGVPVRRIGHRGAGAVGHDKPRAWARFLERTVS